MLENTKKILILSGEGTQGAFEEYQGTRTERALKSKLTKEKCNGDRWARAFIYSHTNDLGDVYTDFETGEQRHI